ncbi:beta-tubulin [Dirofilaria immitis]|nr:beta-tubulin [Dirofilaria immitis]
MGDIIHIQAGRCGNNIGTKFWETISDEHGIEPDGTYKGDSPLQLEHIGTYFKEMKEKYYPRAILIDLEPEISDSMLFSTYGKFFRPDNFVFGEGSANNIWPRGFYSEGTKFLGQVLNIVRKEAERSDYLQGFHLTHSLGGGTGSGLGSLIVTSLYEQYPRRVVSSFSVFPSIKVLGGATDSYNAMLSINELVENAYLTFCIDNEALYNICLRALKSREPTYNDLNHLASMVMSGITSCLRFPGQWNLDLYKLAVNMTLYRKLHFLTPSFAALTTCDTVAYGSIEVNELIQQLFDASNMITACDPRDGHCMAATAMFRGQISMHELKTKILNAENKASPLLAEWIPRNINLDICNVPTPRTTISGAFLGNTTAIKDVFFRIAEGFEAMFRKKAFYIGIWTKEWMKWNSGSGKCCQELDFGISAMPRCIE